MTFLVKKRDFLCFLRFFGDFSPLKSPSGAKIEPCRWLHAMPLTLGYRDTLKNSSLGVFTSWATSPPRKVAFLVKKWKNGVPFLSIFGTFLARAGHKWPLFSQLGKKGTQNGFSGVWSHFCYLEMGQKRTHFGAIFDAGIEKMRSKTKNHKKITFFAFFSLFSIRGLTTSGSFHGVWFSCFLLDRWGLLPFEAFWRPRGRCEDLPSRDKNGD